MSLSGKTLANTFRDLLNMDNSNSGVDSTTRVVKDGLGTSSSLHLSDDVVGVKPQNDDTVATFFVEDKSGTDLLVVDSTNSKVSALGNYLNTQYASFGIGSTQSASFAANTHSPLIFGDGIYASLGGFPEFGTGTDPATTFTTSHGIDSGAQALVPCMWYVPDAISIDGVTSLEGADSATGDVSRMHLFSYTFTSGDSACLTSGTLLAHNSDVTNAGSEQPYLSSWTVDSAAVTAGKVILAFFESDSVNSDYSIKIRIKYHLT